MVYIHIPYCRSFCTYCGFYSKIPEAGCGFGDFVDAVCSEIDARRDEIAASCDPVDTLYIGGGTPSVLPLSALERIVGAVRACGGGKDGFSEFTVEVNPDDIVSKGLEYVLGLRSIGVDRISMGMQAMDDGVLKWMNRRHSVSAAREAYSIIRSAGIDNISVDLIFGYNLSGGTMLEHDCASAMENWRSAIKSVLDIAGDGTMPSHISAYQLSVDPESILADMASSGRYVEAPEKLCSDEYDILCLMLSAAGYRHYEISNFALPGCEARHNSAYWLGAPYVGIGPAAHSFSGSSRRWNVSDVDAYIAAAKSGDWQSIVSGETLDDEQRREETIMLSLRTDRGISRAFLDAGSLSPASLKKDTVRSVVASGSLIPVPRETLDYYGLPSDEPRLRIPESRFFISDSIISSLL